MWFLAAPVIAGREEYFEWAIISPRLNPSPNPSCPKSP